MISIYNHLKYKVNNKYLNSRRLTLTEICNLLNIDVPDELKSPRYLNAHYNICAKSMFYYKNAAYFVESDTPISILNALNRHGSNIFISNTSLYGFPTLVVDNLIEAYKTLCASYRDKLSIQTTIATTGSTGKTTSKNVINSVCSSYFDTFCIPINMNTYRFCGSILQIIPEKTQVYVQEVDEGDPGLLKVSSEMIKPDIAVVTNIGMSHYENFSSLDEMKKNMLDITAGMPKNGVVLINADDVPSMSNNWNKKTISVGINNPNADCLATNIKIINNKLHFTINYKNSSTDAVLSVIGQHNIYNAMYSFVIADLLGIPTEYFLKGLKAFKTSGVRQNLIYSSKNQIIVDCFNAAPASMKTAIQTLSEINIKSGKKRIAVLADMAEFGEMTEFAHREVGKIVSESQGIDLVISYGKHSKFIDDSITNEKIKHYYASTREELDSLLKENVESGDVLLFKGSRSNHLEKSIKKLCPITYFFKIFLSDIMLFHDI